MNGANFQGEHQEWKKLSGPKAEDLILRSADFRTNSRELAIKARLEARIEAFERVRDLPFRISVTGEEDCRCAFKAALLQKALEQQGLESNLIVCKFRWSELGLPESVLELCEDDHAFHQMLSVSIPELEEPVDVDPTWDIGLTDILPIAHWDGLSSTNLAVTPIERFSPELSIEITKARARTSGVDNQRNCKFLQALDDFLVSYRKCQSKL